MRSARRGQNGAKRSPPENDTLPEPTGNPDKAAAKN